MYGTGIRALGWLTALEHLRLDCLGSGNAVDAGACFRGLAVALQCLTQLRRAELGLPSDGTLVCRL